MIFRIIALIIGFIVLVSLLLSAKTVRKIILIWSKNITRISDLPSIGRVEVSGKAEGDAIKSPIEETPCMFWQIEVKKLRRSKNRYGDENYWWGTFRKFSSRDTFLINDGTGKLLIQPEDATVELSKEVFIEDTYSKIMDKLKSHNVETTIFRETERPFKFVERIIPPHGKVFITGVIQEREGQKSLKGSLAHPLLITDRGKRETLIVLYRKVAELIGEISIILFLMIMSVVYLLKIAK